MDNFWYYFKRYLIAIIIIILLLFFPARRLLRQHGYFLFNKKTLKEAILWARQDSIRVADSLKRIEIESKVPEDKQKDLMVKPVEADNPSQTADPGDTYYIIAGSFTNTENANLAVEKYRRLGYKTSIISKTKRNGIKTEYVSVKAFNNLKEAEEYLKEFKEKSDPEAWIYSKK